MRLLRVQLQAGMLPTVLFVSTIITLLCSALVGIVYYRNLLLSRDRIQEELIRNIHSGIQILQGSNSFPLNTPVQFDLFQKGNDSVELTRKPWGVYTLASVKAFRGRHQEQQAALLASLPDSTTKAALYLTDEKRPLTLTGDTRLKGICYLPEAGIRTSYIDGKGFSGDMPKAAMQRKSTGQLPDLYEEYQERFALYTAIAASPQALPIQQLRTPALHSFLEAPRVYTSPENIELSGRLQGNIILHTSQTLLLSSTAQLENVLIVARRVIIRSGFKGQVQVLAQDTVEIENNVQLTYPSAVCVSNTKGCYMRIDEKSVIEGLVIVNNPTKNLSTLEAFKDRLDIEPKCLIMGYVYCDGLTEFKGILYGTLVSRRLFLRTPSALYENYLMDAEINVDKRPKVFLTSPLLSKAPTHILMWLD
ncbi:hypothetical protein QNI19_32735 [Cytophagaceae bacterium DM2B3-1]|uniref:Uncharacterized protein n=1 Tax=Xanthocytophaga flava TaxID=3048013 RepID=A0ABT7CVI8_9BACT|nr:hypothetical protein [Xanthocytophaga flavus]MDJ1497753.1 hypothetical protein [Xanthocytophaga flavus]